VELRGKVALVTGGAVRVGKAITLMLAAEGADVVLNYHTSAEEAEATAAQARSLGVRALPVRCDVSNPDDVSAMKQEILRQHGGVDVIVNSASPFTATPVAGDTLHGDGLEKWQRVTGALVDGPWFITTALAPSMLERGGGVIVNIVDLAVWQPWRGFAAHTAGKSALVGLTRQLALELAPTIRVNAVAPGPVLPPPGYAPEKIEAVARRTLLGRWGSPQDVAHAVRFLIEADYVTGEVLVVDGGERLARRKE
jgi:NAD(P)-dependent dehydrogenase (short-subunit alcohol dehydrogenase family)